MLPKTTIPELVLTVGGSLVLSVLGYVGAWKAAEATAIRLRAWELRLRAWDRARGSRRR